LCKFPKPWYIQKSNFIQKRIFSSLSAHPAYRPSRGPFSFLFNRPFSPLSHWASASRPAQPSPPSRPNQSSSSTRTTAKHAQRRRPISRHPMVDPDDLHQKENNGLINPPLSGVISPLQSPVTDAFNLGPLKLLQPWPLKALASPASPPPYKSLPCPQ
jgi:hypothetical protein